MGMFDYVNFELPCPSCQHPLRNWQSKDGECILARLEPDDVDTFYARCEACDRWTEFNRAHSEVAKPRRPPLTLEQVQALGFVMISGSDMPEAT